MEEIFGKFLEIPAATWIALALIVAFGVILALVTPKVKWNAKMLATGALCIAIGYAVIVTYVLKALVDSVLGTLMTTDTAAWFGSFSAQPYSVIPFHIIVVVGTLLTLFLGAKSIERTNKVMMPLFFVIFLILAVRVAFLAGSGEGYAFMFTPRWEMLADPMIWIWAMGQAFFSLSVTGSGMIVYGAYLSKEEDVVGVAQHTALFDTIAALRSSSRSTISS